MSGTPKAWIIGTKSHLHHVKQTFIHDAVFDETRRRLVRGHLDRGIVVGGANDEIHFGYKSPLIGPVMMRERAARRLNDADPLRWNLSRLRVNIRRSDLRVSHQLHPAFGGVQ